MMIRVCSGFSPSGRIQYGERFLRSFDRYWPRDVELQVYVEEPMPMPRDAYRDLFSIPGAAEFHERHRDNLEAQGRAPLAAWKRKEHAARYSFRFDAYKFWKQILIPQAAAEGLDDGDILIWLDADVETIARISKLDIVDLMGDAEVAFLCREPKHSEIGFWAVRIGDKTRRFLADMAEYFTSDRVFELGEWHSAYVWDCARVPLNMREKSLCRRGAHGHVWPNTPLAKWMRHDKGRRKPGGKA